MTDDSLVHLAGYSTLALILGTATWSSFGWAMALPLLGYTVAYALGYRLDPRRAVVPETQERTAATDGGQPTEDQQ